MSFSLDFLVVGHFSGKMGVYPDGQRASGAPARHLLTHAETPSEIDHDKHFSLVCELREDDLGRASVVQCCRTELGALSP